MGASLNLKKNGFKDLEVGVGVEIFPPKVDGDEVKRVQAHNMLIQTKTDLVKAKNAELDDANWSPYSQSMSICQILGFPDFLVTI